MATDADIEKRYRAAVQRGEITHEGELRVHGDDDLSVVPRLLLEAYRSEIKNLQRQMDDKKTEESIKWLVDNGHTSGMIEPEDNLSSASGAAVERWILERALQQKPSWGQSELLGSAFANWLTDTAAAKTGLASVQALQTAIEEKISESIQTALAGESSVGDRSYVTAATHKLSRAKPSVASPGALRHRRKTIQSGA